MEVNMIKCSICNKNIAVVFVTKIIEGRQIQEGLCVSCAKKQNLQPIDQLLSQTGMTEDELDNISKQVGDMLEDIDGSEMMGELDPGNINQSNPFFGMLNKAFPKLNNVEASNSDNNFPTISGQDTDASEDKDGKNFTKTKQQDKKANKKKKYLDMYGINLIDKAKEGGIDKVIGRNKEIDRVVQILNRRTKNNPVLIGEPGVGKTAIAEGLAVRIADKEVPVKLYNAEVYLLDMTSVVAGTQFRGQFESRMKGIIDEAKAFGNIILVIDELHNIMGAGEAEGAMNAANILKPALSRGEIQVIGATTLNEYRKNIEKDSALERRFQPVIVDEPSMAESVEILNGIKHYYEEYHRVKISQEVISAAVNYSERYITDRFLPDKAIDVIDEAGSRANLRNVKLAELQTYKDELLKVQEDKDAATSADSIDYQRAADLKVYECKLLGLIKDIEDTSKDIPLTVDDVASVIEAWTKIPIQRLSEQESEKLINLESRIHKRVIGQIKAVEGVSKAIRRSRSGFKKKKKPASFIFVGPTGVGKTELVRALAIELFESEESLIRLDMSEYMEKHTVSKLIGSPPGYVGYDDAGQLTEKVRRKPYSVILMDEIEKAHPDVFNMLLQILEDGRLTDSHGRTVSFENTVIIMTSNAGTNLKSSGIGFSNNSYSALESRVKDVIKETFRPEFLNRIDEVVVFTELGKEELKQIIDLMLEEVYSEAKDKDIRINVSDKVKEFILEKGYDVKFGARPLRRAIQNYIEDRLSEEYLKGVIKEGSLVGIDLDDSEIKLSII